MALDEPNLDKLSQYSRKPAFKNNKIYEGSITINQPLNGPITFQNNYVQLDKAPDLLAIQLRGPIDTTSSAPSNQRPANSWFDPSSSDEFFTANSYDPIWGGFVPAPIGWLISAEVIGSVLNLQGAMVKQYTDNPSYDPITIFYRIVDYSVF